MRRTLGLFLAATILSGMEAQASDRPLRILLTNDDGVAASGLRLLRDTLCAAGHQVTVVAPSADRSGTGTSLSLNVYLRATRTEFSCAGTPSQSWAVTGTPSDAVLFGLSTALGGSRPDLVISGMNSGQNVGRAVNHSGTVSAAVTAAEEGVPAIAVSIGLNFQDAGTGFSQTSAAAPHAAAFVKGLVDQLRETAGADGRLIPDRVALNVNYPVVLDSEGRFDPALVQAPRATAVGHAEVVRPQYVPVAEGVYAALGPICGLQTACFPETQKDTDTAALEEGAVSVTPLAVDGSPRSELRAWLHSRLRRL